MGMEVNTCYLSQVTASPLVGRFSRLNDEGRTSPKDWEIWGERGRQERRFLPCSGVGPGPVSSAPAARSLPRAPLPRGEEGKATEIGPAEL